MDLLFLTFGPNIKNHYQANFCILSFLKQRTAVNSINVYTDHPEFYTRLGDLVNVVQVTKAQLQEWEGEHNFFWRVKIKAIEDFMLKGGQHPVVYLDSDTFLHQDASSFTQQLSQGVAFMHEHEGKLSELKSKTDKIMWSQVKGKAFGGVTITDRSSMWNAGVVAIPAQKNLEAIRLALHICDDMCTAGVTRRLIEQFAIAVALDHTYGLHPASPWIGHYWSTKDDWNEVITAFFLESSLKTYTLEQDIERMRRFDFSQLPIRKKVKNTRIRLIKLVDKLFPVKAMAYVEKQ
ncbi:hypothetical protein H9Q13_12315 [Pontibacter sp. JH31]|uniref:Nucleotide-diphospho-sugar transferase n=1 Tax=Pontibacter aquaedesilientis TaxID=2766980 RepID=A0ABR7XI38_9BACT|nr:hypothetical protein [Pontibacter aquaedesilientis]MBD1397952.1 hypothetical protein [Pontibacter aquaedesilientis]